MLYLSQNKDQGFTLIELLITMAVSGIMFGVMFSFLISQRDYLAVQEQVTEMVQGARAAMDMMSREIQMAGYDPRKGFDPTTVRFNGITYSVTQLQIRADLNGNGGTDSSGNLNENITYSYDSAHKQIDRDTGGGNQPFAENVEAFNFDYLDANGVVTTTTANIRQIRIAITVRTGKPDRHYSTNGGYRTYTLRSLITPRNLGL